VSTSISEQTAGGLRWLVVTGQRLSAFRALGEVARDEIRDVLDGMPERAALQAFLSTARGGAAFERVVSATSAAHPVELAELEALAEGAGVDFEAMLLANLRGDLGGDDGTGCSDVGWRRGRSVIAHNEDGAPAVQGRFMLVTLALDSAAPVTTQWYAGFLPSNTFIVSGHGLAWGINHLQANVPAAASGRHFVARGLQQARSLDEAIDYLVTHPSAGGFTYNFGEVATGRVATVESAAGRTAVIEADPAARPFLWHTNHLRYLCGEEPGSPASRGDADAAPGVVDEATRSLGQADESRARGCVLEALDFSEEEPSPQSFLDVLTSPAPRGVYRSAGHGDPLMTLCSTAVDLTSGEVTLQPRDRTAVRLRLTDLASGRANAPSTPM